MYMWQWIGVPPKKYQYIYTEKIVYAQGEAFTVHECLKKAYEVYADLSYPDCFGCDLEILNEEGQCIPPNHTIPYC